ncbi:hypothetical protein DBB29_24820 [Pandoraea cepalis]|uniref:Lipoprotein n=1 Tax=Pandoraea cepalis TaxID=2508294 RepID=A0AAW7MGJ8_9BURK|nr:hypothetical protein [Pandoraea cepalis]MDN4571885.1 hypothetical protein [Pandoraea cepalis]MDN4581339.1 hypothetical protein [Pandoraea cepalis]
MNTRAVLGLAAACFAVGSTFARAEPVVIDTDAARIIVVRPIDLWSGDTSLQEETLESNRDRRVSYDVVIDGYHYRGSPLVLQGISDSPVTLQVEADLKAKDMSLVRASPYLFHVLDHVTISPTKYADFAKAQAAYYRSFVIRQGDPRTLPDSTRVRKFFGNVLTLGSLLIPSPVLGAGTGAQVMLNSGLAEAIGNIPGPARAALTPATLPDLDADAYTSIDVRRIDFKPDAPGQILIAYKSAKTAEIEREALVQAIVAASGADTTPERIQLARNEDLQQRLSLWDACVEEGKCKKDSQDEK